MLHSSNENGSSRPWPRRRRIALLGTCHAPHPSNHLCSAFRRLFKATNKAVATSPMLTREGSALASNTSWGTWVSPPNAPTTSASTLHAFGMLEWGSSPLHLTVIDAASPSRSSGLPVEVGHVIGASALILCFSPFDRESFIAVQQLHQRIVEAVAPCRLLLIGVIEHETVSDESALRQPGPTAKVRVGNRSMNVASSGLFVDRSAVRPRERTVPPADAEALAAEIGCPYVELVTTQPDPEKLTSVIELALGAPPTLSTLETKSREAKCHERVEKVALKASAPPREYADAGNSMSHGVLLSLLEDDSPQRAPKPLGSHREH